MNSIPSGTPVAMPAEAPICPICHDDLYHPESPEFAGRRVAIAKPCGHKFHLNCLYIWTADKLQCPYGRKPIEDMVVEIMTLPEGWQDRMDSAAMEGDTGTLRALLNRGADVDAGQPAGSTPLAWAATNRHLDAALLLADRGAADPVGLNNLGYLYEKGGDDFPPQPLKAESWYLKAAELGNRAAMNNLGYLYENGCDDFPPQPLKAESWYLKAAELGNTVAMNNLGDLYYAGGNGFPSQPLKAESWYLKAAELGDTDAIHTLGCLYHRRDDWLKSFKWFVKGVNRNIKESKPGFEYLNNNKAPVMLNLLLIEQLETKNTRPMKRRRLT